MHEKRKDPRRDFLARVIVKFQTPRGARELRGMMNDRSDSGFAILLEEPIPTGCAVLVAQGTKLHSGTVRHCARAADEYLIGIELDPVLRQL